MEVKDILQSPDFKVLLDEGLRQKACEAAEAIELPKAISKSQLYVIPSVIQSSGLVGLRALAEHQKEKKKDDEIKAFWSFIDDLLNPNPNEKKSLCRYAEKLLRDKNLLKDESESDSKQEKKAIRKDNKAKVDELMESIIGVYFEHFTCQFFYMKKGR
ncbi:MAG TPA: hypothetical protein PLV45_10895 [bacterium]|nr:hypothetical protein [bacterium]